MNVLTEKAGEVSRLVFAADNGLAPGVYEIQLKNMECAPGMDILHTVPEQTVQVPVVEETGIEGVGAENAVLMGKASIYNAAGELMKQVDCDGKKAVSAYLTGLKAGVYVVKDNGTTYKIVKE